MHLVHVRTPLASGDPPGVYRATGYRYDPQKYTLWGDDGEPICNAYKQNATPVRYGYVIPEDVHWLGENLVCGLDGELRYIRQRRAEGHGPDVADWRAMVGRPAALDVLQALREVERAMEDGWVRGLVYRTLLRLGDDPLRQEVAKEILVGASWPYGQMPGERFGYPLPPTMSVLREWERWPGRKPTSILRGLKKAQAKIRLEIELTAPLAPVEA